MNAKDMFNLKGEVAIVTGAGQGLGKEMALALAEVGADVTVADLNLDTAKTTAAAVRRLGRKAIAIKADVTKINDVKRMTQRTLRSFGKIDILVNNAGVVNNYPAEKLSTRQWDKIMEVNVKGVFLCCREVGKVMIRQKKGNIINIASMSGLVANRPQPQAHYNASKAAITMFTKSLAAEWAPYNIRVNAISPGYMGTAMVKRVLPKYGKHWMPLIPMGRIGQPEEIKGPVVFLASEASSYVTGAVLVMDGGYTVW